MNADDIFVAALEIAVPADRAAYLERACAGDDALRREVDSLLAAHERIGGFLQKRPALLARAFPSHGVPPLGVEAGAGAPDLSGKGVTPDKSGAPSEQPGDRIGRYKLLEKIGEGGMGVVWMAEQEEPVRRRVALKIIKLGMDTREVVTRFEAERQALALMDHPNIARVFDGGVVEVRGERDEGRTAGSGSRSSLAPLPSPLAGRPYFVMELVRGLPITKYCDELKMPTRQRLELFAQVCRAVQHAHQKGVIHRDLKPSNILVTEQDGRAVPKVIDFGIAKATEGRLTDKTLFTGFAQLMGTPAYMSPEQAGLGSLDIDTRSDTYSLGVVLYQLLTGHTPFDTKELLKSGYEAVLRTIRETEPVKPSTRLKQERATRPSGPAKSEIRNPKSEIAQDLDWIVMKCLEKDRNRRYDTPNALATDLDRYLHDEPVVARPPSALYRWQKFARKHRAAVTAAAAFILLLAVAAVVSTTLAVWANRERANAVAARNAETAERTRATRAEAEATQQARQAESVSSFLVDTFRRPDPSKDGREVKVADLLEQAVRNLDRQYAGTPKTKGDLLDALGQTFEGLGLYARAIELHEAALKLRQTELGPDHRDTLTSKNHLAMAYHAAGRPAEALKLYQEALQIAQARLGDYDRDTLSIVNNMALTLHRLNRLDEAVALFEQTYERRKAALGATDLHTLTSLHNLALAHQDAGRAAKALPLHEEAHRLFESAVGPRHPSTLSAANDLARAYKTTGRLDDAIRLHEATLEIRKHVLGDDHPLTLSTLHNLALTYHDAGRPTNALPLHEAAHRGFLNKVGVRHADTLSAANDLARVYVAVGKPAEAIRLHTETLAIRREVLGDDHRHTLSSMHNLALAYEADQRANEALPLAEEAVRRAQAKLARGHRYTLAFLSNLAGLCQRLGRTNDALTHWRELLDLQREAQPDDPVARADTLSRIGDILIDQQKFAEAEPHLVQAYEGLAGRETSQPSTNRAQILKETGERLVQLYDAWGKPEKAAEWRENLSAPDKPR